STERRAQTVRALEVTMKKFLAAATLAAGLAACGGGGGGGTVAPPTSAPAAAKLAAGFAQTGGPKANAHVHSQALSVRPLTDPILTGSLIPFATFIVADSYVPTNFNPTITYQAVAYLDTSNGGTLPNPLPTPSFSQTGAALQFLGSVPAPGDTAGTKTNIGAESVGAPPAAGQTTVTLSAGGQSVNLTADTYPGLGVSTASGSSYNAPSGLDFTTAGATPAPSSPDLSIDTSQTTSALSAPHGIVEVNKTIDQVTSADYVAANAVTTIRDVHLCDVSGETATFIFQTAAGVLVKFAPITEAGPNVGQGVCTYTDI